MHKLAIITTHPIQYNAPFFKMLQEREKVSVKVFYTWSQAKEKVFDPTFGHTRTWDIPLLEGYDYTFVKNVAANPGSHHFKGIDNPALIREIEQFNPQAILIYGWSFKSNVKVLRYFNHKVPIFFRGDSTLLNNTSAIKKIVRRIFLRWVYKHIDKALYVGTQNKNYFLAYGLQKHQLVFAPHAVDNTRFINQPQKALLERLKYGFKDTDIVLMYAGKLYELKNLRLLINAFLSCKKKELKLLLVGNGDQETELKDMAKTDDRIVFTPFKNQLEMPATYAICDVFILPSKSETWGLGINEAMACSKPCIVSNKVGCAVDLITPKTGWVFDSSNEQQLANIISHLPNKNQLTQMGEEAKKHINQFSYQKCCEVVEGLLILNK